MKKYHIIISIILIFIFIKLSATSGKHPPVSSNSIIGTWEAIDGNRVYRLLIQKESSSFLCFSDASGSWIYVLDSISVINGKIFLTFHSIDSPKYSPIQINGEGVAGISGDHEEGLLDVKLVMDNTSNDPPTWILTFTKGNYIDRLYKASKRASRTIKDALNKHYK